jgi:hypothetical protein
LAIELGRRPDYASTFFRSSRYFFASETAILVAVGSLPFSNREH